MCVCGVSAAVQADMSPHPEAITRHRGVLTKDEAVVIVTEIVTGIEAVNEIAADEEDQIIGRLQAIGTRAGKEEGACSLGIGIEFEFCTMLQI